MNLVLPPLVLRFARELPRRALVFVALKVVRALLLRRHGKVREFHRHISQQLGWEEAIDNNVRKGLTGFECLL